VYPENSCPKVNGVASCIEKKEKKRKKETDMNWENKKRNKQTKRYLQMGTTDLDD